MQTHRNDIINLGKTGALRHRLHIGEQHVRFFELLRSISSFHKKRLVGCFSLHKIFGHRFCNGMISAVNLHLIFVCWNNQERLVDDILGASPSGVIYWSGTNVGLAHVETSYCWPFYLLNAPKLLSGSQRNSKQDKSCYNNPKEHL